MERRKFIITSGSAILTGLAPNSVLRPAVGLDFTLTNIPDKKPEKVDTLVIDFKKLEITPQYIDDRKSIKLRATLDLGEYGSDTITKSAIVNNGEQKDLSSDFNVLVVEGLNVQDDILSGTVEIEVQHPDVTETYKQAFNISSEIITVDNFEDNDLTEYTTQGSNNWSITSQRSYEGNYSLLHDESTSSTHHITSLDGDGLNQYPTRGDAIEARFYHDSVSDSDFDAYLGFLGESLDSNSRMRGYRIRISPRADTVSIVKWDGSNFSTLDSEDVSNYPTDQWNRIRIELKTNNEIVCKYFDSSGNRVAKSSRIDSEYNGGGITFLGNSGGGRRRFFVDNVFIADI